MDSQRTNIHRRDAKIDILFPEWRDEKVQFDDIEAPMPIATPSTENLLHNPPLMSSKPKQPVWHDTDLRGLV